MFFNCSAVGVLFPHAVSPVAVVRGTTLIVPPRFFHVLRAISVPPLYASPPYCTFHQGSSTSEPLYVSVRPSLVPFTRTIPIKQVAVGARHSILMTTAGSLYVFGDNARGQLGIGNIQVEMTPKGLYTSTSRPGSKSSTMGMMSAGSSSPGRGGAPSREDLFAQIHTNDFPPKQIRRMKQAGNEPDLIIPTYVTAPLLVPTELKFSQLVCGCEHVLAISKGQFYGWGANNHGQLGIGKNMDQLCGEDKHVIYKTDNSLTGWPVLSLGRGVIATSWEEMA